MDKTPKQWKKIKELRSKFLQSEIQQSPYWDSFETLESYDKTLAQRILWKWQFVFRQLKQLNWNSQAATLIDWGCGTGIAARGFLNTFSLPNLTTVITYDYSPEAVRFSVKKIKENFPNLAVSGHIPTLTGNEILLISHVMTELSEHHLEQLLFLIKQVKTVIWVDAGTFSVSQKLIEVREKLLDSFTVLSPCTHQTTCGLLGSKNDWCHFFAKAPTEVFTSSEWHDFSESLSIHLDELPLSYLVMEKNTSSDMKKLTRMIAKPRLYKGYAHLLGCNTSGVHSFRLTQRNFKNIYKQLKKHPPEFPISLESENDDITSWKE